MQNRGLEMGCVFQSGLDLAFHCTTTKQQQLKSLKIGDKGSESQTWRQRQKNKTLVNNKLETQTETDWKH